MSPQLDDFLGLITPDKSSSLIAAEAWKKIESLGSKIPFAPRVLLECRLLPGSQAVDLSIGYTGSDLEGLSITMDSFAGRVDWGWIAGRQAWSLPEKKAQDNRSIWLEFDADPSADERGSVPGVFFGGSGMWVEEGGANLGTLCELLKEAFPRSNYQEHVEVLAQLVQAKPADATVSYIGAMLSRNGEPLRIQVSKLSRDSLETLLGVMGTRDDLANLLDIAYAYFDTSVLCLDLSPGVSRRVGLELFPSMFCDGSSEKDFLSELVKRSLCCPQKITGIEAWPGYFGPERNGVEWPDHMIVRSLVQPDGELCLVERRVNHFKLVAEPGERLEAKVYLSARMVSVQDESLKS